MELKQVPFTIGGFSTDPNNLLLLGIAAIVAVLLMYGVRREFATFAIAAGVIGAILAI